MPQSAPPATTNSPPHAAALAVSADALPRPTPAGLRAARQTRAAVLVGLLTLVLLCAGWELWWAPVAPGGSWLLTAKCLPLLLALSGVLRMRMYTYRWLCLLVWLYLTEGVVRAFSDPAPSRWLALAEVALSLWIFIGSTLHIRLRFKHARAGQANSAPASSASPAPSCDQGRANEAGKQAPAR